MGVPVFGPIARALFGTRNQRMVKRYLRIVAEVNRLEPTIRPLTDAQLREKTAEFRRRFKAGEKTILVNNPNWWDKPTHNLTEVIFTPVSNPATRIGDPNNLFTNGQDEQCRPIDGTPGSAANAAQIAAVDKAEQKIAQAQIQKITGFQFENLARVIDAYSVVGGSTLFGWDYLAGMLICHEAGAVTMERDGADPVVRDAETRRPLVASTRELATHLNRKKEL